MPSKLSNRVPKSLPAKKAVRIMVFGTFDIIHPGHRHFFKQARALAGKAPAYLIVSLARDKNVKRIKGRLPSSKERARLARVKLLPEVDQAVMGALEDHVPPIVKLKPDIIALGYDQKAYVKGLRSTLVQAGTRPKIVRLKPHKPHIYKTSLLAKAR